MSNLPQRLIFLDHDEMGTLLDRFQLRGHIVVLSSLYNGQTTLFNLELSTAVIVEGSELALGSLWGERGSHLATLDLEDSSILAPGYRARTTWIMVGTTTCQVVNGRFTMHLSTTKQMVLHLEPV